VIDGLLQTEDYARTLLYGKESDVQVRMSRQGILTRTETPPPLLIYVLSEIVLRHEIGGPKVMHDQLLQLAASASERVRIHVVPNGVVHPGVRGSFVLATLADRSEVAYVETGARAMTLGESEDLQALSENFEMIRSHALPVGQSIELILRTAEEIWT
jgi:Domain of unknown function (DUF5753)